VCDHRRVALYRITNRLDPNDVTTREGRHDIVSKDGRIGFFAIPPERHLFAITEYTLERQVGELWEQIDLHVIEPKDLRIDDRDETD
jgi:hypothetical protein